MIKKIIILLFVVLFCSCLLNDVRRYKSNKFQYINNISTNNYFEYSENEILINIYLQSSINSYSDGIYNYSPILNYQIKNSDVDDTLQIKQISSYLISGNSKIPILKNSQFNIRILPNEKFDFRNQIKFELTRSEMKKHQIMIQFSDIFLNGIEITLKPIIFMYNN